MKYLSIIAVGSIFGLLASTSVAATTDGVAEKGTPNLGVLECVKPDLTDYWNGEHSETADEFVLIYSIQGFWADIESRFPPTVIQAIRESSTEAIDHSKLTLAARDMPVLSADFYGELQKRLSKLAGLPEGACGIQVGNFSDILDKRYRFFIRSTPMGPWFMQNHINELNLKNHEFLSLFSKGTTIKGSCSVVWKKDARIIKVCE